MSRTMTRGEGMFVGLTVVVAFFAILKLFATQPLTYDEKQAVEDRLSVAWPGLKFKYGLHQLRPVIIWDEPELYGGVRGAVAATVCSLPAVQLVFDPDETVADPDYFALTTVPHELAHAILCELDPGANEHTAKWKSLAVALGMRE